MMVPPSSDNPRVAGLWSSMSRNGGLPQLQKRHKLSRSGSDQIGDGAHLHRATFTAPGGFDDNPNWFLDLYSFNFLNLSPSKHFRQSAADTITLFGC